mmetsp:Transcript_9529/g.14191  ORF Transcript_9529/g.14191 Transcript_9529/m.14191 type:complete len:416 (+) Transcript_9529:581-1828(+)
METHTEGEASITLKGRVFLNPAQVFNRDISVLVASEYAKSTQKQLLKVLEPLAASGIRSIRYSKELPAAKVQVHANDISSSAFEEITHNFKANSVAGTVSQMEAKALMQTCESQDIIDIDPYGSCAEFLDSCVQAVCNGGLLCITSTDMGTLCGNSPDTCFYKYQSIPSKNKYCHEFALRILLYQLNATANKYQKAIQPLLSLSVDFYVRVFVVVSKSAKEAKKSVEKSGFVLECNSCPAFYIQKLGKSATLEFGKNCQECGGALSIHGPIYLGPLHCKPFVKNCLDSLETCNLKTSKKVRGVLTAVHLETETPLYWNFNSLAKFFKTPNIPQKKIRSAFKSLELEISQSHTKPYNFKTNASVEQVFQVMKAWKDSSESSINFSMDLEDHERQVLKVGRYTPNPRNWGPKSRPKP